MTKIYLVVLSLITLSTCQNSSQNEAHYLDFQAIEEKILDVGFSHASNIQWAASGDSSVWIEDFKNRQLVNLNLETGEIKQRVAVNFYPMQYLISFLDQGEQGMLILLNAAYFENYAHDSSIFVWNPELKQKSIIDLSSANLNIYHDSLKKGSGSYQASFIPPNNKLRHRKQEDFIGLMRYSCSPSQSCFVEQQIPSLLRIKAGKAYSLPIYPPQPPLEIRDLGSLADNYAWGSFDLDAQGRYILASWPYSPWIM